MNRSNSRRTFALAPFLGAAWLAAGVPMHAAPARMSTGLSAAVAVLGQASNPFSTGPAGGAAKAPPKQNPFGESPTKSPPTRTESEEAPAEPEETPSEPEDTAPSEETPADSEPEETPVESSSARPSARPSAAGNNLAAILNAGPRKEPAWSVSADPADLSSLVDSEFAVDIPRFAADADPRWERTRLRVLFPRLPSPFVGLGLNEKTADLREIWNLRTQQKVGEVKGLALEGSRLVDLSPDGAFFAAKPQFEDVVEIVDVASGRKVESIPLGGSRVDLVAFAAGGRLLIGENGRIRVFTMPDRTEERAISIPDWTVRDGWRLSPGGRLLAVLLRPSAQRDRVAFYDVTTGESAGAFHLGNDVDCRGVAFSHDGQRLIAAIDLGARFLVELIDLETPQVLSAAPINPTPEAADGYQGGPIDDLLDGRHLLLLGRTIVDGETGERVQDLDLRSPFPVGPVGRGVYAYVQGARLTSGLLPGSAASSAAPSVAAASTSPDDAPETDPSDSRPGAASPAAGALPPADRTGARTVKLDPRALWDVRLKAPPEASEGFSSAGIKIPGEEIAQIILTPQHPSMAVVNYVAAPLDNDAASRGVESTLKFYELSSGELKNEFAINKATRLAAVSLDAKHCAAVSVSGEGRVDVWSDELDVLETSFRPADASAAEADPWFVEFIDGTHLLTAVGQELTLWTLPEAKAVYSVSIGGVRPVLSPARDVVVVADPNDASLFALDALTGDVQGARQLSNRAGEFASAFAFQHRGRWLAALTCHPSGGELLIIETESGEIASRSPLPVTGEVLQWCGENHLLVDGRTMIGVLEQSVAWRYELPLGLHCRESVGGRHWYASAVRISDRSYVLQGVTLPEEPALRAIENAGLSTSPLVQPGDSLRLAVETPETMNPEFEDELLDSLKSKYDAVGSVVTDSAPAVLLVRPYRPGAPLTVPRPSATPDAEERPLGSSSRALSGGPPLTAEATISNAERMEDYEKQMRKASRGHGSERPKSPSAPRAAPPTAAGQPLNGVWEIALLYDEQPLWVAWLTASRGRVRLLSSPPTLADRCTPDDARLSAAAMLVFEPPKFGFNPVEAEGAGLSRLTTRGPQRDGD